MSTEKPNSEKTERENGNMSQLVIDKIRLAIKKGAELNDILHIVIENPFKILKESNMPVIDIRLHKEIEIPKFIGYAIADREIKVYGIEIDNNTILIKYVKENGMKDFESVDLGYRTVSIKELFMLIYVFNNLSENDLIQIFNAIDSHINKIENEKDLLIETLKGIGIELGK